MDRSAPHQLTAPLVRRRADALTIVRAAVEAVSPRHLMPQVAATVTAAGFGPGAGIHVVAAGKAAVGMYRSFIASPPAPVARAIIIGPNRPEDWAGPAEFVAAGHPFATAESERGAALALEVAAGVGVDECLVCLLSGGASALMAAPIDGLSLDVKQQAVGHVMRGGADITALNTVRKHLSRVKGGRLAAACRGTVLTFAISDVIGDDLSVIGSGPCVADWSTWDDAAAAAVRHGGWDGLPPAVQRLLDAGRRGEIADTPKAGDPRLARARAEVIGGRRQAMDGARRAAAACGYVPVVIDEALTGEAREAAPRWWSAALADVTSSGRPLALISSGETTVRVRGGGRGGRNQEFALALVDAVAGLGGATVLASIGTDGIDGPTEAAGALVDATTRQRAAQAGLDGAAVLAGNDSYRYFAALGDLVVIGPTGTNVGDVQLLLAGPA